MTDIATTPSFNHELVRAMEPLRKFAMKLTRDPETAQDLRQRVLTRALAMQHLWVDRGVPLNNWLGTIMHNEHINGIRREAVRANIRQPLHDHDILDHRADTESSLIIRDLVRALGKLKPEHRDVVLLIGYHGMPYDDVAARLDIPVGTVRSRLSRGREKLRSLMEAR